jgi:NTE family protein
MFLQASEAKVGIVLSGGGVRGIAHLGVLKALNEAKIFPHCVSGTSAGAIVGSFYCQGYTPEQVLDIILQTRFLRLLRPAISWRGIFKMRSIELLYSKYFLANSFSGLKIPLTITATNLTQGQVVYFSEGEIIKPLMASTCIPGIFDPVRIGSDYFVDGGILNNLPIEGLQGKCDFVIGVNCNHIVPEIKIRNIKKVIERSVIMSMNCNVYNRKSGCDLFIEPPGLARFGAFEIGKAREIFEAGYSSTKLLLKENSQLAALARN